MTATDGLGSPPADRSDPVRHAAPGRSVGAAHLPPAGMGGLSGIPARVLRVPGTDAVLDLGGVPTATGGRTAFRRVLRADRPVCRPEPGTAAALRALGVGVVIDLRTAREEAKLPAHLHEEPDVTRYRFPLGDDAAVPRPISAGTLTELYQDMLHRRGRSFVSVIETVVRHRDSTVLLHCRGGRDRTGLAAALLLLLAGASTRNILADQALVGRLVTAEVQRRRDRWIAKSRDPRRFDEANSHEVLALGRMLTALRREYGDVPGYLRAHGMCESTLTAARRVLYEREDRHDRA